MRLKIGITGGIGSGKSYICGLLKERGIPVYNCDNEAKRLMIESISIRSKLNKLFNGNAYIYNSEIEQFELNKPIIAQFLFAKKENANQINEIVHPAVKQDFLDWAEKQNCNIVAQENAILFESGFIDTVDLIIEVYATKKIRLMRSMKRDNASEDQIEARMAQQMDEEEKKNRADFCIVNNGTSNLDEQIDQLLLRCNIELEKRTTL